MDKTDLTTSVSNINTVNIFGVRIHALTIAELHQIIAEVIQNDQRALVLNVNVHALNLANKHPWLRDALNEAEIVFCDGAGVIFGAQLLGQQIPERITYADWFWQLGEFAEANGYSMYFLGAKPGIAKKAAEIMIQRFPRLKIIGTHNGYFDKTSSSAENEAVIHEINSLSPDILTVGMGMPLQERWLHENWDKLNVHVGLAGGAVFDYISGELKRAPTWMNNNGLEWLGRLAIEPRRLWHRYLIGNPLFIGHILGERFLGYRTPRASSRDRYIF